MKAPVFGCRRRVVVMLVGAAAGALSRAATAERGTSPVKLLVGFPPGGAFDAAARLLAESLREPLGRAVIVENRAGAAGTLAADALQTAAANGSVLMLGPDALTSVYTLTYKHLNYSPADLQPICQVMAFPFCLLAGSSPPAKSFAEYVRWAKTHERDATYGIAARGAPPHFLGQILGDAIGVKMTAVPFRGGGQMVTSLVGGQVSAVINPLNGQVVELHRSGRLQILCLSSPKRVPQLPDVPTFAEVGYSQLTIESTNVLYAPAATPSDVITKLADAVRQVLAKVAVKEQFAQMGFTVTALGADAVKAKSEADLKYWGQVVKASGFQAE
jgi:tripartite-type tricarboxylate transporter receptor subunit TctC